MADEALLAALAGATLGEATPRPGDGLAISLHLAGWCGRPQRMPERVTLEIEDIVDRASLQARLAGLDERSREIAAACERGGPHARRTLEIRLSAGAAPLLVDCRDYAIATGD